MATSHWRGERKTDGRRRELVKECRGKQRIEGEKRGEARKRKVEQERAEE